MNLNSRLQRIEKLAQEHLKEMERKTQKRFRYVVICEGTEPTPHQRATLEYNKTIAVGGAGYRAIIIRCQSRTR